MFTAIAKDRNLRRSVPKTASQRAAMCRAVPNDASVFGTS